MLWQRILTALVLMPLVVAGILYLDTTVLALLLALALLLGAHEMARLANLRQPPMVIGFAVVVALMMWLMWEHLVRDHLVPVQWLMSAWWLVITVMLIARRGNLVRIKTGRPAILALGGLVLLTAWLSIVTLHASGSDGPVWALFLFVLIWVADSGAYFAGRAFGRRKLAPVVSPGKTWAGAIGAFVGAALCAVFLALGDWVEVPSPLTLTVLAMIVTLVSIGGDLWVSRLKREAGVKDSGQLLPGHGGILDRIDSLLAAAPVYALGLGLAGVSS